MSAPHQALDTELQTYERNKDDLLQSSEGKFALIKGDQIIGTFDTKLDAIAVGHQQLGPGPFLVKRVARADKAVRILMPGDRSWP